MCKRFARAHFEKHQVHFSLTYTFELFWGKKKLPIQLISRFGSYSIDTSINDFKLYRYYLWDTKKTHPIPVRIHPPLVGPLKFFSGFGVWHQNPSSQTTNSKKSNPKTQRVENPFPKKLQTPNPKQCLKILTKSGWSVRWNFFWVWGGWFFFDWGFEKEIRTGHSISSTASHGIICMIDGVYPLVFNIDCNM